MVGVLPFIASIQNASCIVIAMVLHIYEPQTVVDLAICMQRDVCQQGTIQSSCQLDSTVITMKKTIFTRMSAMAINS